MSAALPESTALSESAALSESIKAATEGEVCRLALHLSHTAEHMAAQADIASVEAQRSREDLAIKERPTTLGKGKFGWADDW